MAEPVLKPGDDPVAAVLRWKAYAEANPEKLETVSTSSTIGTG